jgi:AAA family ATP:ADP antiporter
MRNWLAQRLQLEYDESCRALTLGTVLFGLIAAYTLVKTARDAFFLTALPAQILPYLYLGVGALTAVASTLFGRMTRRWAVWETLAVSSLVAGISLVLFVPLLGLGQRWVPLVLYLWVNVYGLLLVAQFWSFANNVSHAREAKRTFGVIGVGGILGGLAGGLLAAPLVRIWAGATPARESGSGADLPPLLLAAAVAHVAVAARVWSASRRECTGLSEPIPQPDGGDGRVGHPLRHSYVRWLALATLCSVMVATLLDFQFKVELQRRFTSSVTIASFLGLFYTATNLAALTLQVFGTRWMIQRLGAAWSAAWLPAGLAAGAGATLLSPGLVPVVFSRLWDQVMRLSLNKSAGELFYFPLEPGLRRRAKAFIEAGVERLGDGLAGLVILGVLAVAGVGVRALAGVVLVVALVWVMAWLRVRRGYVSELGVNLKRLSLDPQQARISLREAAVLEQMTRLLDSPYERLVVQGMNMIEENVPEQLDEALERLLVHRSPQVRARALQLAGERRIERLRERIASLLHDEDPEVRVQALSAHSALAGDDPLEPMREFLHAENQGLRTAAILSVVERAPVSREARVRAELERLLRDGTPADREAVADALGRRPPPCELHDLLDALLRSGESRVRRAALRSAGIAQRRAHVTLLIEALGDRDTQQAAREGLARLGDRVVGTLGDWLADPSVAAPIRHAIPRALGDIHTQESVNALFRVRERGDVTLAHRVIKGLNRIRASGVPVRFPRATVTEDIDADVRAFFFAWVNYRVCPLGKSRSAERLLYVALNERMDQALNRIFRRLALLYPALEILAAYQGVVSESSRLRGDALEYLENALAPDHRVLVMPLVDDGGDEARLQVAERRYGLRSVGFEQTLEAVLQSEDSWLRACALYVVGSRRERTLLPLVESNLSTLDGLVRETASWARLAIVTG